MQDKIVVFDRIRENSPKYRGESFSAIANRSLHGDDPPLTGHPAQRHLHDGSDPAVRWRDDQAVHRRDAGGACLSGTYSSIFNAVPLLVGWHEKDILGVKRTEPLTA